MSNLQRSWTSPRRRDVTIRLTLSAAAPSPCQRSRNGNSGATVARTPERLNAASITFASTAGGAASASARRCVSTRGTRRTRSVRPASCSTNHAASWTHAAKAGASSDATACWNSGERTSHTPRDSRPEHIIVRLGWGLNHGSVRVPSGETLSSSASSASASWRPISSARSRSACRGRTSPACSTATHSPAAACLDAPASPGLATTTASAA